MVLLSPQRPKGPAMGGQDTFFHYLPVSEQTMQWGVYVTGAGCCAVKPGERYPQSGHPALYQFDWVRGRTLPEFQMVLITDGAGEFESKATGSIQFEGAALIFLFPGVWHRYRPVMDVGWNERWVSFNGELLHRLFDDALFGPKLAFAKPHNIQQLIEQFDRVLDSVHRHAVRYPAVLTFQALEIISGAISHRIQEALHTGAVAADDTTLHLDDPVVQKALELIWTHSHYPMSVSDIARQLPVTRRTLDRRFVEATGHSVLEEINACRLSRAKRLLSETDLPVKTVAHLAGFSSTERMRVVFVEREGVSPTLFRRQTSQVRPGG